MTKRLVLWGTLERKGLEAKHASLQKANHRVQALSDFECANSVRAWVIWATAAEFASTRRLCLVAGGRSESVGESEREKSG